MSEPISQLRLLLTGPVLCGLMLAGIAIDHRADKSEADYEAFHLRAADAVGNIPLTIGAWAGREEPLSPEELRVLKPNAYRCIAFTDTRPVSGQPARRVLFLLTQCRQAGNMEGHYPPNCYPSRGYAAVDGPGDGVGTERTWTAGNRTLTGVEYFFERRIQGRVNRTAVYNFMVLPEKGVRPDMESVNASAEDYQQRYYGAAQFQLVFGGPLALATPEARAERDAIFSELIGPCSNVITTLCDGVNSNE
jgi:hypothetical protein